MPKKTKVDTAELIAAVESGQPGKEIMAKFGLKTLAQLKSLYVDALSDRGMVPSITTSKRSRSAESAKGPGLKVNKRGSLVVPREMIEEMGFDIGDTFSVRRTAAGVSLKKA